MSPNELSPGDIQKQFGDSNRALDGPVLKGLANQAIQSHYGVDGVVIDANWQIRQFRGQTGFYLEPARGEASYDLLPMVRKELRPALKRAVITAMEKNLAVQEKGLSLKVGGESRQLDLQVLPLSDESSHVRYYLVIFEKALSPGLQSGGILVPVAASERLEHSVSNLERELAEAHDYIRDTDQEHTATLEEVRAAAEEIGSANEELQSVNEQLETAKEELESTNAELTMVNDELEIRNEDLTVLSSDLSNLLNAIKIPVLMVDRNLRLRRFTSIAEERFHLTVENVGQSLADLTARLPGERLDQLARDVMDRLTSETRELQDENHYWWSLTVRPYQTADKRIDGALLIFSDIDVSQRTLRATRQARDYADTIIDTVCESLVILAPDFRVRRANSAFYRTFHLMPDQVIGQVFPELYSSRWDSSILRHALEEVLENDREFSNLELELSHPFVGAKCLRLSARHILQDGVGPAILLAIEDVTEQDRAKQALLRSNEDLQRFASVAAHDLQEPLRTVASYTQLLTRRCRALADDDSRQFAQFVSEGVSRMQAMIRDLLEYARVTQTDTTDRQKTSVTVALQEALANLQTAVQESGAEITHGELPTVLYNGRQLAQVFQNLIGNAIKYRRADERLRVRISALRQDRDWVVAVADNGAGFAPEHAGLIFGVFKRLHSRDYPGTGIGLAICLRIVEHHAGRIWAESVPGSGSTFSFTIPITQ